MKLLLDLDGVMVTAPSWQKDTNLEDGFPSFNQKSVYNLNSLISKMNPEIVLISSHRNRFKSFEWIDIFRNRGINITSIEIPNILGDDNKAIEIETYLKDLKESYIIIDDDSRLNGLSQIIKVNCVITKSLIGFDDEALEEAVKIFEISTKKTWAVHKNKHEFDIYVGRPSKYGNPYTHIQDGKNAAEFIVSTRDQAISEYRKHLYSSGLINDIEELRGKRLGCWCCKEPSDGLSDKKVCHAEVLAEILNEKFRIKSNVLM